MNISISNSENPLSNYIYDYFKLQVKHNISIFDSNIYLNKKNIEKIILKNNLDAIIHLDPILDIDKYEKNPDIIKSNIKIIQNLINACKNQNIKFIYISSFHSYGEYSNIPYVESDSCEPINNFGLFQYESEKIIKKNLKKYFIIKSSWIFGGQNCYIKQIISNSNTPLFFCSKHIVNPTHIKFISSTLDNIINTNKYGVYNCASQNSCSKIELSKFIFDFINVKKEILPIPKELSNKLTRTAKMGAINSSLLENTFNIKLPNWKDSVCDYILKEL